MIYFPSDETYNKCYEVLNNDIIRAYDTTPLEYGIYSYRDYFIHSDYYFVDNVGEWGSIETLPFCLDTDLITHDEMYRIDYYKSLFIFTIFFIFIILIPLYIITRFFKKGRVN